MVGGHTNVDFAQFTSTASTATVAHICFGYVPDYAKVYINIGGTNSDVFEWANILTFDQWIAATDSLKTTGSSGNRTLATTGVSLYAGGDTVAAADVTNRLYFDKDGNVLAAGVVTTPGIQITVAIQTQAGKNFVRAYRTAK
jgi:hypothetical protein